MNPRIEARFVHGWRRQRQLGESGRQPKGQVVGLIFDRNLQSVLLDFTDTEKEARALGLHGAAILEGLRTVYDAEPLVREILGESSRSSTGISSPR